MHELTIERNFAMPVEKLFDAFTQPETITKWFAPENLECTEAKVDLKVGGQYSIRMDGDDEPHIVVGEYLVIEPHSKLVFSWRWHTRETTTRVSLAFKALDNNNSQLLLKHDQFPDQALSDKHNQGWMGCLANLEKYINTELVKTTA
jgi:uncharacterized protein YndB with AHSA1/START domain